MNAGRYFRSIVIIGWVATLLLALSTPALIEQLGHAIDSKNIPVDYYTGLLWAFILGMSIFFWPVPKQDRRMLFNAWAVKSLVVLSFMLIYENHYDFLDSFGTFIRSRWPLSQHIFEFGNGTLNIRFLACLHNKALPDSFHAMKLSFALVGLIAIYIFYKAFALYVGKEDSKAFYLLAFWPSILFWSSILGKDPITLLGVAGYTYGFIGYYKYNKIRYLMPLASGILITMSIRLWMGPIMIVPLFVLLFKKRYNILVKFFIISLACVALIFSIAHFNEAYNIKTKEDALKHYSNVLHGWEVAGAKPAGSMRQIDIDFTDTSQFAGFAFRGIFTALFRPLPGEYWNIFGILSGIEGLAMLLLFIRALRRVKMRDLKEPLVQWAIVFILTWSVLYSGICYRNAGTAVRYRLQILPIYIGLLAYLGRRHSPKASHIAERQAMGPGSAK